MSRVNFALSAVIACLAAVPFALCAPPQSGEVPREQAPAPRLKYPPTDKSTLRLWLRVASGYGDIEGEFQEGRLEVGLANKTETVRERNHGRDLDPDRPRLGWSVQRLPANYGPGRGVNRR